MSSRRFVDVITRARKACGRWPMSAPADVPTPVAAAALLLAVAVTRHLMLHAFELLHFSALFVASVLLLPEVLGRLCDRPEFAAKVFVRRAAVIGTLVMVNLVFAVLLAYWYRPWHATAFTTPAVTQFFLEGALVGGAIRSLFVIYLRKALGGGTTEYVEAMLLAMVAIYLTLFPAGGQHDALAVPYLLGIGGGFVAHFLIRTAGQRSARDERFLRKIEDFVGGADGPPLQARELTAVKLFVKGKLDQLREHLKVHSGTPTAPLVIAEALMEHSVADYSRAEMLVDAELQRSGGNGELDTYLLLLKALCIADRGDNPDAMFRVLDEALRRNPECTLCQIYWALRTTESIPLLGGHSPADERALRRAYGYAIQALRHAGQRVESIWGPLVAHAIPLTSMFLLDAFAYVALRMGDRLQAKAMLEACIHHDPKFAAPYVHLGELYVLTACESSDQRRVERCRRLTRISLCIAIELERGRETSTKRRAEALLRTTLEMPGVRTTEPANGGRRRDRRRVHSPAVTSTATCRRARRRSTPKRSPTSHQ
jgi:hypothetical protein